MKSYGFTLIEILVSIAIFSILVSIATYSYLHMLPRIKLQDAVNIVYSGVNRTKSEAIKRGEKIRIHFDSSDESFKIQTIDNTLIFSEKINNGVDILKNGEDSEFFLEYDGRGIKTGGIGANASISMKYKSGGNEYGCRRVRVTTAGGISIQSSDNCVWN